jgi:subtilisin-like proprotein convertase family protein
MKFKSFLRFFGGQWLRGDSRRSRRRRLRRPALEKRSLRLALEGLEERTLLSVLPPPVITSHMNISGNSSTAHYSSPSIAVDPTNPQKIVAVFVDHDPALPTPAVPGIVVQAVFSNDGGGHWNFLYDATADTQVDYDLPATATPVPFPIVSEASVAFDRNDQAYIVFNQHNAGYAAGAVTLVKFDFTSDTPTQVQNLDPAAGTEFKLLYTWAGNEDPALNVTMAVDNNPPLFVDPDTGAVQQDPFAGTVYVAWGMNNTNGSTIKVGGGTFNSAINPFDPNPIKMVASSDGGVDFTTHTFVNDGQNVGNDRNQLPKIVISQGTASGSVAPGQVSILWDDYGTFNTAAPLPFDQISFDRIKPNSQTNPTNHGVGAQFFDDTPHAITDAIKDGITTGTDLPQTTNVSFNVNIGPNSGFLKANDLEVTLAIAHPALDQLNIQLLPPTGSNLAPILLLFNNTDDAGNTTNFGLAGGAGLGVTDNGSVVGTVFDDFAERNILDTTHSPHFTAHYQSEGLLFGAGLNELVTDNGNNPPGVVGTPLVDVNGTWTLQIVDNRNGPAPTGTVFDADTLFQAGLTFTSGLVQGLNFTPADIDNPGGLPVTTTFVRGGVNNSLPYPLSTFPHTQAGVPNGIGPGVSVASDNTLGSFSAFQGRLYAAYTDFLDPRVGYDPNNPADNTDIFMVTSDDGGLSWTGSGGIPLNNPGGTFPPFIGLTPINHDNAAVDGYSAAVFSQTALDGRPQLEPSVAVDPSSGAVAVSFLDARDDPQHVRFATYVTTSLDGGATYSKDTFLNTPAQVFDGIEQKVIDLGPIPTNEQSATADTGFLGFGDHQGLTFVNGHIWGVWSDNENAGFTGTETSSIFTANATVPYGPHVTNSTMGVITGTTGTDLATGNTVAFNGRTINVGDVSILEGDIGQTGLAVFPIFLSNPSTLPVTVQYFIQAPPNPVPVGRATPGQDYTDIPQTAPLTLTLQPGQTQATITVQVLGDNLVEGNETFFLTLANATNAAIAKGVGTGTIIDNEGRNVSIGDITTLEGNSGTTNFVFNVYLSAASANPVTVDYSTQDGTALVGDSDYQQKSGTITFAPNQTVQQITISVTGDTRYEPNENFFVNLSNAVGANLNRTQGTGTIIDDDRPGVTIGDVTITEGNSGLKNVTFTVFLGSLSNLPVTVTYSTQDGTGANAAKAGTDYVTTTNTVTIPAGSLSATFTVPIIGNILFQPNRTFFVNLSNPINGSILRSQATATIIDDEGAQLSIGDMSNLEGFAGTTQFVFTVYLSNAQAAPVTFRWSTADGTATAASGDYVAQNNVLGTIPAGATSTLLTVNVNGDLTNEPNENFFVNLSNPSGTSSIARPQGRGTIINDDAATSQLSVGDTSRPEGNAGSGIASFNVFLSKPAAANVTFTYTTIDGTATAAGGDYTFTTGTGVITPGSSFVTISVPVRGDTTVEQNENFFLRISNPSANATILANQGTGTIINDDVPFNLSVGTATLSEGATGTNTTVTIPVFLSSPSNLPVTFNWSTADGTAVSTGANADYRGGSGLITIPAGQTSATITLDSTLLPPQGIIGDNTPEPNENFFVNISNPVNATVARASGTVTIVDDDQLTLSIGNVSIVEGNSGASDAVFTVYLSNPSTQVVRVQYNTADGTATVAGNDYATVQGTLTFNPGQTQQTIAVPVIGDTFAETNETFFVNLSRAVNAALAGDTGTGTVQATGTIIDDDGLALSVGDVTVLEGDSGVGSATFTVYLSTISNQPVMFNYATSDGPAGPFGAIAGLDYITTIGSKTIPAGAQSVTITVPIMGNTIFQQNRLFFLNITGSTNAAIGKVSGTATMIDDDQVATDGSPQADGFIVTFDRPIDPASFDASDVTVLFRDTQGNTHPVTVTGVNPLFDPNSALTLAQQRLIGPDQFFVSFQPQSQPGTYSYQVGPNIRDRIRGTVAQNIYYANIASGPGQNRNLTIPDGPSGTLTSTITVTDPSIADPRFASDQHLIDVNVNVTINHPNDQDLVLTLIAPSGQSVILAQNEPNFVFPPVQNFTYTTFDDSAANVIFNGSAPFTGSFNPEQPPIVPPTPPNLMANFHNLAGSNLYGDWKLQIKDTKTGNVGQLVSWSLQITTSSGSNEPAALGNNMDQNGDGLQGEDAGKNGGFVLSGTPGDVYTAPRHDSSIPTTFDGNPLPVLVNGVPTNPNPLGSVVQAKFVNDSLPLIVPGPHVVNTMVDQANVVVATGDQINLAIPSVGTGGSGNPFSDKTDSVITVTGIAADQILRDLNVTVSLSHAQVSDLVMTLIAPDGITQVQLYSHRGGTGSDVTNLTFDDQAANPISAGVAPFLASFRPETPLSVFNGTDGTGLNGNWTLRIQDTVPGNSGRLLHWSLGLTTTKPASTSESVVLNNSVSSIDVVFDRNMDPNSFSAADVLRILGPAGAVPLLDSQNQPTVTVTPDPNFDPANPDPDPAHPRTFRITFPTQTASGNYSLQLSAGIQSAAGDALDSNQNAGLDLLRNTPTTGTLQIEYGSTNSFPLQIGPGGAITSTINVNDDFVIPNVPDSDPAATSVLEVQLDIKYRRIQDLEATLIAPDGTQIELFQNVGNGQDMRNVVFADNATTPIQSGNAPFGTPAPQPETRYNPVIPLRLLKDHNAKGAWQLIIKDDGSGISGQLNTWKLRILKPIGSTLDLHTSSDVPKTITGATGSVTSSKITVANSYVLPNTPDGNPAQPSVVAVQMNATYAFDPDLQAWLTFQPTGGGPSTRVQLFTHVGDTGTRADFNDTIFADNGQTPIAQGGPPFFGKFQPEQLLGVLKNQNVQGTWTLSIENDGTQNRTGTLNSWSLTFLKPVPPSGEGEPVADQKQLNFRLFNVDPTGMLSHSEWTPLGPASTTDVETDGFSVLATPFAESGRVNAIAMDPSDPTGNTVYVGGASGGVWKTNNFLTNDPRGPSWTPLTDFGPITGVSISSIAVFGRNNDPKQSVIYALTGESNALFFQNQGLPQIDVGQTSYGVGVLKSSDGGATWSLLDSTDNTAPFGSRDHVFAGTTGFKILVDPHLTPSGENIVYMALGEINNNTAQNGVWRSVNSGKTWQQMRAGQVTDLIFDLNSGYTNAQSNPTGNLQILYAGFMNDGIYQSPNRGLAWNKLSGNIGDPLIQMFDQNKTPVPVQNLPDAGAAGQGRIVLAKPALTGNNDADTTYQGWLYAAVVNQGGLLNGGGHLAGLFLTKDFGQTWTQIRVPTERYGQPNNNYATAQANDANVSGVRTPAGSFNYGAGNWDITLTIDPTNPNVLYLGGNDDFSGPGFIRVDTTGIHDAHAFYLDNQATSPDTRVAIADSPMLLNNPNLTPPFPFPFEPRTTPTINFIHNPTQPFLAGATLAVQNVLFFANDGGHTRWTAVDQFTQPNPLASSLLSPPTTGLHQVLSLVDPLTGHTRLIVADDYGVYTAVDKGDGTLVASVGQVDDINSAGGNVPLVNGTRNGNLQLTQFYQGATQPSLIAAQLSTLQGMFFGTTQSTGFPASDPNELNTGNLSWTGTLISDPSTGSIFVSSRGSGNGIATDPTGGFFTTGAAKGAVYLYSLPGYFNNGTNFIRYNGIGRTSGLVQNNNGGDIPDAQWPFQRGFKIAVNPVNADQVLVSSDSGTGKVFRTDNQGKFWLQISPDSGLDAFNAGALAFGAPQPNDPVGGLNNFLYAGTNGGRIFMTFIGGGQITPGNPNTGWSDISNGLDGSPIMQIVTDPTRGSRDAFAVTKTGVFYLADAANPTWVNVTGNLLGLTYNAFGPFSDGTDLTQTILPQQGPSALEALAVDWRYAIPNDPTQPAGATHPVVYVAGAGGVFRSTTAFPGGATAWSVFPNLAQDGAQFSGGLLPNVRVTSLQMSLGNINPTNGRPQVSSSPDLLVASTYGRGDFAITLAPVILTDVFPLQLDPTLPVPTGSDTSTKSGGASTTDNITRLLQPVIDGFSEQSAFGNTVTIDLLDLTPTDATFNQIIGTGSTDQRGFFSVQIKAGIFKADGSTDGAKIIGVRPTDGSGTVGNVATFQYTLDTTPVIHNIAADKPHLDANAPLPPSQGGSDSGLSFVDKITNVIQPIIDGNVDETAPVLVQLINQTPGDSTFGTVIGSVTTTATGPITGSFSIQVNPGVWKNNGTTDGLKTIALKATNGFDVDLPLTIFTFTLDTIALPPTINLSIADDTGISNTDHITKITVPHFVGLAEAGARVDLYVNGVFAGSGIASGTGAYSIQPNTPLQPDGAFTVTAIQTDLAGNVSVMSGPVTPPVVIDTVALPLSVPDLLASDDSGKSNTDNITNINKPHFTGAAEPGAVVQIFANGILRGSGVATGGVWNVQISSPLADGVYSITAVQTDIAGNVSLPSGALSVTIDTVAIAPGTPNLDPISDTGSSNSDHITKITTPNFLGTNAEAAAFVELFANGAPIATVIASGSGNYAVPVGVYDPSNPVPPGALFSLADGTYAIQAQQVDLAGNVSVLSAPMSPSLVVVTSVAPPSVPNLLQADDTGVLDTDHITKVTTPRFQGVAVPGATVTVTVKNGATTVTTVTTTADGTGAYLAQVTTPLLDGAYSITATQTDVAGNVSVPTAPMSPPLVIDTQVAAPSTPSLLPADDSGVSNTDHITNVTAPRFTGTSEPNARVLIYANGQLRGTGVADGTGNFTVQINPVNPLADGAYNIQAQQIDSAGNQSGLSGIMQPVLIIDTLPPAPSVPSLLAADDSGPLNNDHYTNVNRPRFTGNGADPNAQVQIFGNGTLVGQGSADGLGNWTVQVTTTLADGVYDITARQINQQNKVSPMSGAMTPKLTVDTQAPAPPGTPVLPASDDTGTSNSDHITDINTPHFTGTGEVNATVQILVNGVVNGAGVVGGSGTYFIQVTTSIPDGTFSITAKQTDLAGNVSSASGTMAPPLQVLTTKPPTLGAPNLLSTDDTGASNTDHVTSVTRPHFGGNGVSAGNTVQIYAAVAPNGTPLLVGSGTPDGTGTYLIQPTSPFNNGTYLITATQTDIAGNVSVMSPAMTPNLVIDTSTASPSIPNLVAADDTGLSNSDHVTKVTTPSFSGSGASAGATISLFINNTPAGSALADGSGNYVVRVGQYVGGVVPGGGLTTLTDGTYQVTVSQKTLSGNSSSPTAPMTPPLVIDTQITVPTLKLHRTDPSASPDFTAIIPEVFDGTADPNAGVVINDASPSSHSVDSFTQAAGTNAFTRTISLALGVHPLTVVATDLAGNTATSATFTLTVIDFQHGWVQKVYNDVLGRDADQAGLDFWVGKLNAGVSRFIIASAIEQSDEGRVRLVSGWYNTYLGITGDLRGLGFWANQIRLGDIGALPANTEEFVLGQFLSGDAYFNRAPAIAGQPGTTPSNATYITALFRQLLGRAPTPFDLNYWVNTALPLIGRAGVATSLARSAESRIFIITGYYVTLLRRSPPPFSGEVVPLANSSLDWTQIREVLEASAEYFNTPF